MVYVRSCRDDVSLPGSALGTLVAVALLAVTTTPLSASEPNGALAAASCCNVV